MIQFKNFIFTSTLLALPYFEPYLILNLTLLVVVKGGVEVQVFDIEHDKLGTMTGHNAPVDEELDELEGPTRESPRMVTRVRLGSSL